jgi:small subunit ribosomal protein S1
MNDDNEKNDEIIEENSMEEESFAVLLRDSFVKPVRLNPGQKLKARVVKISPEWIFIDLGGKSEGYLDIKEFLDEEGKPSVQEGDLIEAYFISSDDTGQRFASRITGGQAGQYYMEDAYRNGIPVEGVVEKEIKGGFEIKITGGLRGFCPFSQMGLQREANPGELLGSRLAFRITQYDEKGRNIVLSNRFVLEDERQRQKDEQKGRLREGARVKGTIGSIHSFGAFIKIGAVEGLIPISEIAWERVEDINALLTVGQEVEVVVMKLDWEKDRFSFSMKQALPDPWESIEKDFPPGSHHNGAVVRLTNFGAFVSLAPGVDGLIHISRLGAGKRIKHPHEAVEKGQIVEVKIDGIDRENKRISLSLAGSESEADQKEADENYSQYLKKSSSMGTMADLMRAKLSEKSKK